MVPIVMNARCAKVLAVLATALLTACTTLAPEQGIVDAEPLNENEGIVFGVLMPQVFDSRGKMLSEKNTPDVAYEIFFGTTENASISRVFTGFNESISGTTRQPRTFVAMRLPAGEYSLFNFYRPFEGTTGYVPTDMRFTVEPNKATYIGSLEIQFRSEVGLFGQERIGERITFKVVDDKENATREFTQRNPQAKQETVSNPLNVRRL